MSDGKTTLKTFAFGAIIPKLTITKQGYSNHTEKNVKIQGTKVYAKLSIKRVFSYFDM